MEKKEHLYKILVIGDLGTGKTSIIKRYVHNFFSVHYRATVSFHLCYILLFSKSFLLFTFMWLWSLGIMVLYYVFGRFYRHTYILEMSILFVPFYVS